MKLNKPEAASAAGEMTPVTGGATIAARFQLDADPQPAKKEPAGVGKTSTLVALLAALAALGALSKKAPFSVRGGAVFSRIFLRHSPHWEWLALRRT